MSRQYNEKVHQRYFKFIYENTGINLEKKQELLKSRLAKRMNALKIDDYDEYLDFVLADKSGNELKNLFVVVSTNFTSFFREPQHFEFLKKIIIPKAFNSGNPYIRGWSAASSSGEEVYSILLTILENVPNINIYDFKMLATDISEKVLEAATNGNYTSDKLNTVPKHVQQKYFNSFENSSQIKDFVKQFVRFRYLNLLNDYFPFNKQFDFIFCRNVIIYFDKPTQQKVINKLYQFLKPSGYLIVGHSESLTGIEHSMKYVEPTVYQKLS